MPRAAAAEGERYEPWRIALLGLLAFMVLMPVTLPVTVLRGLVQERFGVSELLTSLFMSINMMGAALAAPAVGALADRLGRRRRLVVAALVLDGVCLAGLALPIPFWSFMALRFVEGCAHIAALSLLMALATHARPEAHRGRALGVVGAGLALGVALGAPIGGLIGRGDPLAPLWAGSALVASAALLAWAVLRETESGAARPRVREIAAAVREHRTLLAPLGFAFADRFTVGFFATTFSLYLTRIHALSPPQVGLLMMALMLPFALLSVPFGRLAEHRSRVAMVCWGSLVYGVGTASLGWWPVAGLSLLMPALGIASAVMFVPSMVLTTEIAPGAIRSTALGGFNAAGSLGFIAGPLTGGAVSQWVAAQASWEAGYRVAFVVAGASEIACVLLTLPVLRRLVRARRIA